MNNMPEVFSRKLGRSDLEVSALGMGCWAIGGTFWSDETPLGWGEVDDDESGRAIQCVLEMGVTFFDTADVYGAGHSERVLGHHLASVRDQVFIATKFGNVFDESTRQVSGMNASPAYIHEACEASLRRLGTEYIDLYQFHWNDYDPEKASIVRDALEDLVTEGKIRYYGWSTDFPERAQVFAQGPHCVAIQHQINVLDDNAEMINLCEKSNLASINRGPLAMGLLTEKYKAGTQVSIDDVRGEKSPDWMTYFKDGRPHPDWLKKVEAVREILRSDGRTLAQGALAWLWARSPMTLPIPGIRTVAQAEENCQAMAFGPLDQGYMVEIAGLLSS
jgi:aryl-alcohol dehydrogenase-like predicted oxidoreductase